MGPIPYNLDAVPFGAFLPCAVLQERSLAGEGEGRDGLPVGGGRLPRKPMSSMRLRYISFLLRCPSVSGDTSERSPLPSRGTGGSRGQPTEEGFSEGHAEDFGALGFARGSRNP